MDSVSEELGTQRDKALDSFKLQKQYFQEIEKSNSENLSSLFNNITIEQTLALFYLLYFIYKKEIPVLGSAAKYLKGKHYRRIISKFRDNKLQELLEDESGMKLFVQSLRKAFPYLVEPILHHH